MTATGTTRWLQAGGRRLDVGETIGDGGEGTIHRLEDPALVAKLWHPGVRRGSGLRDLAERLRDGWADATGHRRIAAVRDLVWDDHENLAGVIVERLPSGHHHLANLLTRRDRSRAGLSVTPVWQLRVTARIADIVARAHARGMVLADLSVHNFAVDPLRARVTAFDVDAWQLLDAGIAPRRIAEDARAPEHLQGDGEAVPTLESDRWSLAVLVVQVLFDSWHPHDGSRAGSAGMAPLVGENVRDGVSHFSEPGLSPAVGAPRAGQLPPRTRRLVLEAFGPGHSDPPSRPPAASWVEALSLDAAELVPCGGEPRDATRSHRVHPAAECRGCAMRTAGVADPYAA